MITDLHLIDSGKCYRGRAVMVLAEKFEWQSSNLRLPVNGFYMFAVIVPKGFATDFATIPRLLWWLLPPTGPWRLAAVAHDWMYSTDCPRFLCDAVFREIMYETDVPVWQRVPIYYAVRCFGWMFRR